MRVSISSQSASLWERSRPAFDGARNIGSLMNMTPWADENTPSSMVTPGAHEGVARDLAVPADERRRAESPRRRRARVFADAAAVQIQRVPGLRNRDVLTQDHVGRQSCACSTDARDRSRQASPARTRRAANRPSRLVTGHRGPASWRQ